MKSCKCGHSSECHFSGVSKSGDVCMTLDCKCDNYNEINDGIKAFRDSDNNLHITGYSTAKPPAEYIYLHIDNLKTEIKYEITHITLDK